MNGSKRLMIGGAIAALVIGLDQWSKALVLADWPEARQAPVPVIPTIDLAINWNHGVSFSMGNNLGGADKFIFVGLSLLVTAGLLVWMFRGVKPLVLTALGMIVGGALGNSLDRIRFGAVEDFIYFHVGSFQWPVFNLADSAICLGAGLMIFDSLFDRKLSHKNTP